jgi:hypothetical protein
VYVFHNQLIFNKDTTIFDITKYIFKKKGAGGLNPSETSSGGETPSFPPPTIMNYLPINIFLPSSFPRTREQYGHTSGTIRYSVIGIPGEVYQHLFPTNNMIFPTNLVIQDMLIILTKEFHRPCIKSVGMKSILTTKGFMKIKEDD